MLAHSLDGVVDGPVLVFAHGITADRTRWDPLVERLRDEFRCLTVDLPGHGESGDEGCDSLSAAVAIHEVVDHLDLGPHTIVGHSLGATISLLYGALFSPRSLVAFDPVGLHLPTMADTLAPFVAEMQSGDFDAAFESWQGWLLAPVPEVDRARLAATEHPRKEVVLSYWSSLLRREDAEELQPQFTDALAAVTVPALICMADPLGPADAEVLSAVPSPTVEIYEGATHFLHLLQPDRFADRIRTWVRALP